MKKTLVIGASEKPERYSYKAIKALRQHNHEVVALAPRIGKVEDVTFETEAKEFSDIDTVTLYVGPQNQDGYMDYIERLKPRRVIFNPGTENQKFKERLDKVGIESEIACTLVLLSIGQY
ncbi:CoA-binding protein [Mangrovibacterium lignilyticum]|uniref:CoA-binding protein n=1 Tax=Mangrovibacterium lignilyticum TaxID=2668052 RepID=UPI0013D18190|nr:CoA-binding protein [Mangrovibacterium lignilyticum]